MDEEVKSEPAILEVHCSGKRSFQREFEYSSLEQLRNDVREKFGLVTDFSLFYEAGGREYSLEDAKDFKVLQRTSNTLSPIPVHILLTNATEAFTATATPTAGHTRDKSLPGTLGVLMSIWGCPLPPPPFKDTDALARNHVCPELPWSAAVPDCLY
ncbi:hypothetical protein C8R45DRAFT_1179420 [Mycena sanguinolenta]|nr:hypothetical protein C8R45DRAFT_1179420 [Mycena sanguinolenta]